MTHVGRQSAVSAELFLASEELDAARLLLEAGRLRAAVGHLYFAAFHLARALVYHADQEPRRHAGVRHVLHQEWILPGRLDAEWGRLLARLQRDREKADYEGSVRGDEASAAADLEALEAWRDVVERLVSED